MAVVRVVWMAVAWETGLVEKWVYHSVALTDKSLVPLLVASKVAYLVYSMAATKVAVTVAPMVAAWGVRAVVRMDK